MVRLIYLYSVDGASMIAAPDRDYICLFVHLLKESLYLILFRYSVVQIVKQKVLHRASLPKSLKHG